MAPTRSHAQAYALPQSSSSSIRRRPSSTESRAKSVAVFFLSDPPPPFLVLALPQLCIDSHGPPCSLRRRSTPPQPWIRGGRVRIWWAHVHTGAPHPWRAGGWPRLCRRPGSRTRTRLRARAVLHQLHILAHRPIHGCVLPRCGTRGWTRARRCSGCRPSCGTRHTGGWCRERRGPCCRPGCDTRHTDGCRRSWPTHG